MRRAARISAGAHVRTMQRCAGMIRAGREVREYHLDAELLHEFRRHGSQYPAYGSIVAAGGNACVLHYRADAGLIRAGELVLIDAGCELDGYAIRHHPHLPGQRQIHRPAAHAVRAGAGLAGGRGCRHQAWCPFHRPA
jgi:hypothetical protein